MLFFICSNTVGTIQKSRGEQAGIVALKPAVTALRDLPLYLNVYLGLEQGDLRQLEEQITGALRSLDREMGRYKTAGKEMPNFPADWDTL